MEEKKVQEKPVSEKAPRKDVYYIDVRKIKVIEGFNVRIDYGDMEELTESIRNNGIKEPLHGFKERGTENYFIFSGHRRLRAAHTLNAEGVELRAPFIIDDERKLSQEQRLIDMILYNEGKKFNPLEEAEVVYRLKNYHLTETEIAKKLGKSLVYISNLAMLYSAPTRIKNLVKDGAISPTLAMEILRANKGDGDKSFEVINAAIQKKYTSTATSEEVIAPMYKKEENTSQESEEIEEENPAVKKKITKKDIDKAQCKANSVTAFRKLYKSITKHEYSVKEEKKELFDFLVDFINGSYTQTDLLKIFFGKENANEQEALIESEEEN